MLGKFENWLAAQKDGIILWFPVFLGLGSALYFSLRFEPPHWQTGLFLLTAAGLFAILCKRADSIRPVYRAIAFAVLVVAAGFAMAQIKTVLSGTPILLKETRPLMAQGTVIHTETLEGRKGSMILLDQLTLENFLPEQTPKKIRLTSRIHAPVKAGDRISVLVKLMPPSKPVMPGAYDFRRHYFFDGVGATGFVLKKPVILSGNEGKGLFLEKLRRHMGDHIRKILPTRISGIVTALVTGERAAIQESDWEALRIAGLAHFISISGLHVVLMAAPIFFFIRFFLVLFPYAALHWPVKKIAAVVALIGCTLYVGLVVPTVPTYRALMMTAIGLIAIMMDRSPFSLRLISFAATVVLVLAPESIWSASFQLSFAAVLSLILSAEWTRDYWTRWRAHAGHTRRLLIYLGGSVFTTLAVSLITAPLSAYHFQQIPVYSVVANALIIPLSAIIIMPATIATFLLWPFELQDAAIKSMGYGIEWMLAISEEISSWPFAAILLPAWPLPAIACFALAGLCLYLLAGRLRWAALPISLVALALIFIEPRPALLISDSGELLLVRMGDEVYISSGRRDKFEAENWVKRLGREKNSAKLFPSEGRIISGEDSITCGGNICRIVTAGHKITFGKDEYALKQDCLWADIIVTLGAFRDRKCGARIYNKFTLQDSGTVSIDDRGNIKTVASTLGERPWSPKRKFNDKYVSGSITRPESGRGPPSEHGVYMRRSPVPE